MDLHCLQRQGISGFSRTRGKYLQCTKFLFDGMLTERWAVNSNPVFTGGIYRYSVFTSQENTPKVANTGQLHFFASKYCRDLN